MTAVAGPVFLSGPRIDLRPFESSQISDTYVAWLNDGQVNRFLGVGKSPSTADSARRYVDKFWNGSGDVIFSIVDRAADRMVGTVTLHHVNWPDRNAETGLMIGDREFWGRRYAFEAWHLVLGYAFGRLGLHKVTAGAIAGNEASVRTLRKLGFRDEAVLREQAFLDGEFRDVLRFGLLAREFTIGIDGA